jgi:hypothetical protein
MPKNCLNNSSIFPKSVTKLKLTIRTIISETLHRDINELKKGDQLRRLSERRDGRITSVSYGMYTGAGIAQWYSAGLRAGAGNFSLHHLVQTGSGTHPASYPMGTSGSFLGVKAAGARS